MTNKKIIMALTLMLIITVGIVNATTTDELKAQKSGKQIRISGELKDVNSSSTVRAYCQHDNETYLVDTKYFDRIKGKNVGYKFYLTSKKTNCTMGDKAYVTINDINSEYVNITKHKHHHNTNTVTEVIKEEPVIETCIYSWDLGNTKICGENKKQTCIKNSWHQNHWDVKWSKCKSDCKKD